MSVRGWFIAEKSDDPVVAKFIESFLTKLPQELAESADAEKRGRRLVLLGLPESTRILLLVPGKRKWKVGQDMLARLIDCLWTISSSENHVSH